MSWTCACGVQNLDAARWCEFCATEHAPSRPSPPRAETAWSPSTPAFQDEPWRRERRMTPAEVEPYLAELRVIARRCQPTHVAAETDPDQTRRYLAACAARRTAA